jgi:hypothetical protein
VEELRAMMLGGCLRAAVDAVCRAPDGPRADAEAVAAASTLLHCIELFADELQAAPVSPRKTPQAGGESTADYVGALKQRLVTSLSLMCAGCSAGAEWWAPATAAQLCGNLASTVKKFRTPTSVGKLYTPVPPLSLDFTESLRPVWDALDAHQRAMVDATTAAAAPQPRADAAPPPRPPSAQGSSSGFRAFRPRPPRPAAAPVAAAPVRNQGWVFGAGGIASVVCRHESLWQAFEQRCRTADPTFAADLARAAGQAASIASLGVVPWPETLLDGLAQCRTAGDFSRLPAPDRSAITAWLRASQRRWHPDRFVGVLARAGISTSDAAVAPLLARVTKVSQVVNDLRASMEL